MTSSYEQAVWAWAAHLRSGGTTPWSAHGTREAPNDVPTRSPVPDAVHLELVRRLNLASGGRPLPWLADHVLTVGAPGRGRVDVPLPWEPAPQFGTRPIDPSHLPVEELLRLAVGVLATLLPDVRPPRMDPGTTRWPLPWRRRFRLHGSPGTVAAVREGLLASGPVESDWRAVHVVLARPVDVMMAEQWSRTIHAGGTSPWNSLWRRAVAADRLPRPVDVATIAARLLRQPGVRERDVHVVAARDTAGAASLTAALLSVPPFHPEQHGELAAIDLVRRVNVVGAIAAGPRRVRELTATAVSLLDDPAAPLPEPSPVLVPPRALTWARAVAARTTDQLSRADYAVHGDPEVLAPSEHQQPGTIDRERTLELALAACLRAWQRQEGPR